MTYKEAVKDFKENYVKPGEYDYWTLQLMWATYVDSLCKDKQITQKQFNEWETPFTYGVRVLVAETKKFVELR